MLSGANHRQGFHSPTNVVIPTRLLSDGRQAYQPMPLGSYFLINRIAREYMVAQMFRLVGGKHLTDFKTYLGQGADLSATYKKYNVLTWAGYQGSLEIVNELLNGVSFDEGATTITINPFWADEKGNTVLHTAAHSGHVNILISVFCKVSQNQRWRQQYSHLSVQNMMRQFFSVQNHQGETPAVSAAKQDQVTAIKLFEQIQCIDHRVLAACVRYAPGFKSLSYLVLERGYNIANGQVAPIENLGHFSDEKALCGFLRCAREQSLPLFTQFVEQLAMSDNARVREQFHRSTDLLATSDEVNHVSHEQRLTTVLQALQSQLLLNH